MTLQRFLNAVGDSRWAWGPNSWKPAVDKSVPLWMVLRQIVATTLVACIPGAVFALLLQRVPQMKGGIWPLQDFVILGLLFGTVAFAFISVAWNRRAAQLRRAGLVTPPTPARMAAWQRWILGPVYALALFLITPLALALALDNALGTAAWNKYRAQLAARGEPLTFAELAGPPPSSDLENFARTPFLKPAVDFSIVVTNQRSELVWNDPVGRLRLDAVLQVPTRPEASPASTRTNAIGFQLDPYARGIRSVPLKIDASAPLDRLPPELARRYGLLNTNRVRMSDEEAKALAIADPAAEVLEFLKRCAPEMDEVAEASQRPRSRFVVGWDDRLSLMGRVELSMPVFAKAKSLSTLFRIRAAARLEKGDAAGAFADTTTLFRLAGMLREEPTLIALLVRIAQESIAMAAVSEGIATHRWSDAQLAAFQELVRSRDLREGLARAFRGERLLGIETFEDWLQPPTSRSGPTWMASADGSTAHDLNAGLGPNRPGIQPRGMFRRFQVAQSTLMDHLIADLKDPAWPRTLTRREDTMAFLRRAGLVPSTRATILAVQLAPALDKASAKVARLETTARLADVACALERHRLKHGAYPESLDALTPAFLPAAPLDPMSGQPVHYQRTDNGWFKLWSVGLNGRDDGGVMKPRENDTEGDWVWPTGIPSEGPRLL